MQAPDRYIASWNLTDYCNFKCSYCFAKTRVPEVPPFHHSRLMEALDETGAAWTIVLTGGEPFLYPDFIHVCEDLTKKHLIAVDTNLSIKKLITEFSERIDPTRVDYIYASSHLEEREKRAQGVSEFIDSVRMLTQKGFRVRVNYVLHPSLMGRVHQDISLFREHGIELLLKPFIGQHGRREYPEAYSEAELTLLRGSDPDFQALLPFYSLGLRCNAGRHMIRILPEGVVTRCVNDATVIGSVQEGFDLYEEARRCRAIRCTCFGNQLLADPHHGPLRTAALKARHLGVQAVRGAAKKQLEAIRGRARSFRDRS